MQRITSLAIALVIGTAATAQTGQPGAHFVENWDLDGDGQVSLMEVTERRGDIFVTFDENDDGTLSAQDYVAFDAARAADQENEAKGQGNGGQGRAKKASAGMELGFNDINGDGVVSHDEFLSRSKDWFNLLDRNQDGSVTTADFGPRG